MAVHFGDIAPTELEANYYAHLGSTTQHATHPRRNAKHRSIQTCFARGFVLRVVEPNVAAIDSASVRSTAPTSRPVQLR